MKRNKTSYWIAAGFLILSTLACNLGKSPDPAIPLPPGEATVESAPATEAPAEDSSAATSACDNPYQPIIAGASWNYKLTGLAPDTFVRSILSVNENEYTDQDVFGTGVTRQSQWKCDNGSLIALNPSGGGSSSVNTEGLSVDFQTTELSGVTLPANLNPGDTWNQTATLEGIQDIGGTQIPAKNNFSTTCTAIGIESVTVEAGTFDAMRFDCQTVMNISLSMQDNPIETTITINSINWHTENIGLVKTTTTGEGFDSTIELTSYNIP